MIKVTHTSHDGGAEAAIARIRKYATRKVAVGIPSDKDARTSGTVGNADLVYIHTHGVRPPAMRAEMKPEIDKGSKYSVALQMYLHEHGSVAYQVPARPIIEPAIENAKKQIAELLADGAKAVMAGEDGESQLNDVGLFAQGKVKAWFTSSENGWPSNAQSTIKAKGSDKPLIDSGALRNAITFVVVKGGGST